MPATQRKRNMPEEKEEPTARMMAIAAITNEVQKTKMTKVGLKRIRQAAKVLGLSQEETVWLEYCCEYRNSGNSTSEVWARFR
jgi:hypothetical protein